MMAKMFYTLEEAKQLLGKNEEEIKQYAREGRLREFRDGPRLMFKADQVEAIKAELQGGPRGDQIDLGPSDTGAPIGLVDSRSASGTGISLVDTGGGSSIGMQLKDDTALAADLGLSGSGVGGVPSPGRTGAGMSSRTGINVLGPDDSSADPSAATAVSGDQVNLDGGSGSGLLDLTRESDDTSLGAELLDEISPGASKKGSRAGEGTRVGTRAGSSAIGAVTGAAQRSGRAVVPPNYVEAADPMASGLGAACLASSILLLLGGFAFASALVGTKPALFDAVKDYGYLALVGIGAGAAVVFAIIGMILGRGGAK
jgi:hypothetical protein